MVSKLFQNCFKTVSKRFENRFKSFSKSFETGKKAPKGKSVEKRPRKAGFESIKKPEFFFEVLKRF